jgi:hypothetical protein
MRRWPRRPSSNERRSDRGRRPRQKDPGQAEARSRPGAYAPRTPKAAERAALCAILPKIVLYLAGVLLLVSDLIEPGLLFVVQ